MFISLSARTYVHLIGLQFDITAVIWNELMLSRMLDTSSYTQVHEKEKSSSSRLCNIVFDIRGPCARTGTIPVRMRAS